jgi:hypothetical protein
MGRYPLNPIDPRLRAACDLYNRSLAYAFQSEDGKEVKPQAGVFPLPFGALAVSVDDSQLLWSQDRRLSHFVSAADLEISGLNNRYIRPVIGASLAASTETLDPKQGVNDFVAPKVKVPTNLFLRIERPKQDLAGGYLRAVLELHTETDTDSVRVDERIFPLEYEPTAALAYQLHESDVSASRFRFFIGDLLGEGKSRGAITASARPYSSGLRAWDCVECGALGRPSQ